MCPSEMSRDERKLVFGVSDQVRHKPACTVKELGKMLEILDLGRRGIVQLCSKNKGTDQLAVTAQLICALGA